MKKKTLKRYRQLKRQEFMFNVMEKIWLTLAFFGMGVALIMIIFAIIELIYWIKK